MKMIIGPSVLLLASTLLIGCSSGHKAKKSNETVASMSKEGSKDSLDETIASWPSRPRLAIQQMMGKYGPPTEVSEAAVIWRDVGDYKRILVTKMEIPHDFPMPHMDFLEHTVSYMVPADKADELLAFDGSITISRTAGEMSARCDLEGHNILTLNLANDIVKNNKGVQEARTEFGKNVVADFGGQHPAYVEKLQFKPHSPMKAAFSDTAVIPGSPIRATANTNMKGDAEIMGKVLAVDLNEVLAASTATKKDLSKPVMDYAKMLQMEHAKNQKATMMLGQNIGMKPADTKAVDELKMKGANELSMLVPLKGEEFEKAYIAGMIKNHNEVLAMIDNELMPAAQNKNLISHLKMTRDHVAMHLEKAKEIEKDL